MRRVGATRVRDCGVDPSEGVEGAEESGAVGESVLDVEQGVIVVRHGYG